MSPGLGPELHPIPPELHPIPQLYPSPHPSPHPSPLRPATRWQSINFKMGDPKTWRKASILSDCVLEIVNAGDDFTGNMLIDDTFLLSRGYTQDDLAKVRGARFRGLQRAMTSLLASSPPRLTSYSPLPVPYPCSRTLASQYRMDPDTEPLRLLAEHSETGNVVEDFKRGDVRALETDMTRSKL